MIPEWLKTEFDPLTELIQRDKLPHALLIHGPAGTGRRLLALSIIGRVLGIEVTESEAALATGALVDEERAPVHPDFRLVQIPVEKRFIYAGVADRVARPDQARALWRHWGRPEIEWG